jgi:hypothetical protein
MSTLKEIATEEEWNLHTSTLPSNTLQIISFHAPWAARMSIPHSFTVTTRHVALINLSKSKSLFADCL